MNIVTNGPAETVRSITDSFRESWARVAQDGEPIPKLGMSRHVVVARHDAAARASAREAYRRWFDSLLHLWRVHGKQIPLNFPEDPDEEMDAGLCLAGSVDTVRTRLVEEIDQSGINYLLCRLAFGNLTLAQSLESVQLLQHEIIPALET